MTILTESSNERTADIDLMSTVEIIQAIHREDEKVAEIVWKQAESIARAVDLIVDSFHKGGRLAYFGAGTSGRLGVLDASECPPTFGVDDKMVSGYIAGGERALRYAVENAEDRADFALLDLADFAPTGKDVVVGISASGNPVYVLTILEKARLCGAKTIGITSNPQARLAEFSDVLICTPVGPEVVTGSSRMKSGTAQKMVLNMLSTASMIRIGKTYKNYMIDVRSVNDKLIRRACRFISEIGQTDEKTAQTYFEKAGRNVKTACVMIKCHVERDEAEKRLHQNGGILRKVIK